MISKRKVPGAGLVMVSVVMFVPKLILKILPVEKSMDVVAAAVVEVGVGAT